MRFGVTTMSGISGGGCTRASGPEVVAAATATPASWRTYQNTAYATPSSRTAVHPNSIGPPSRPPRRVGTASISASNTAGVGAHAGAAAGFFGTYRTAAGEGAA